MAPRSCVLQKKFPFIQKGLIDSAVTHYCAIYNSSISIANTDSKSIQQSIDTNKRKKSIAKRSSNIKKASDIREQ